MQIKKRLHKDKWTISIVTAKEMKKIADDDVTCGLCVADEKAIYIREDSVDYSVIAHELWHAYWSYLYLSDTSNVTLDDAEEIGASFFAAEGVEMVKKAKEITTALKKMMED